MWEYLDLIRIYTKPKVQLVGACPPHAIAAPPSAPGLPCGTTAGIELWICPHTLRLLPLACRASCQTTTTQWSCPPSAAASRPSATGGGGCCCRHFCCARYAAATAPLQLHHQQLPPAQPMPLPLALLQAAQDDDQTVQVSLVRVQGNLGVQGWGGGGVGGRAHVRAMCLGGGMDESPVF